MAIGVSALMLSGCGKSAADDAEGNGGSGGSSNSGGGSGPRAGTGGDWVVTPIRPTANPKLDLLLVIDNSTAMGEKQRLLAESMPLLMRGLESASLDDVHVGIVTSSLGHHGSEDVCSDLAWRPEYDDRAQLLPSVRPDLASWNESGFLAWDPGEKRTPPGVGAASELAALLMNHVGAVGETGCAYESSLEAWYRFLIDPDPVASVSNDEMVSIRNGTNAALLEQRRQFLRPDSQLAIVMLTDENDCSIVDEAGSQGWLVGFKGGARLSSWRMPKATAACAIPNSPCCRPCPLPPALGCPASDLEGCPRYGYLGSVEDAMSLRCFQQAQRFGLDLLYPVQRYIDGLSSPSVDPRANGNRVQNPLFSPSGGPPARTPDMIVLLGIVGVPWQDIASSESLTDPRSLRFLTAAELAQQGRWEIALGDPAGRIPPTDPFMIESIEPRAPGSAHPLIPGAMIVAPHTNTPENPINGHEIDTSRYRQELQYACTFPLRHPIQCSADNAESCACNDTEFDDDGPLCTFEAPATHGIQHSAQAHPSIRPLELIRALGDRGLVGSICPKNVEPAPGTTANDDAYYGYNPALSALVQRLAAGSAPSCLSRDVAYEATSDGDRIACHLIEASFPADGNCSCNTTEGRRRLDTDSPALQAVLGSLEQNACGGSTGLVCSAVCACEVSQLEGAELTACQNDSADSTGSYGFCYIDGASESASSDLVQHCPADTKRRIRMLGTPQSARAHALLVCPGR